MVHNNGGYDMRIGLLLLVLLGMGGALAHADTIHLKNGNTIEGQVVEKTADGVKIDIGGVTLTYYADEIASIDAPGAPGAPGAEPPALVDETVAERVL